MNTINKNKQTNENVSLLKRLVKNLEWRRVEHRHDFQTGKVSAPFMVCPLCGGVEDVEYIALKELQNDYRFHKGHYNNCLFSKIDLSKF